MGAPYFETSEPTVLGGATLHALAPHAETGGLHFSTHEVYGLRLGEAKLQADGFKWCSVLPGHFYNARNVSGCQIFDIGVLHNELGCCPDD